MRRSIKFVISTPEPSRILAMATDETWWSIDFEADEAIWEPAPIPDLPQMPVDEILKAYKKGKDDGKK